MSDEQQLEGPPVPITIDMVQSDKAAGPSGIVVETIKASGDTCVTMIRDLATAITRNGKAPTDRSKYSLSAFTWARVMLWTEATIEASSCLGRPCRS